MSTTVNAYPSDLIDGNPLSAAQVNALGDGSELHHVNLCELFGAGIIGATGWNLGIVAGQIALTITAGQGIVGDAGERKVCATESSVTIDSDQGLAAGAPTTYYVFKKRDLTTATDDATGFIAQTSSPPPADTILIGTASMGATEAASVDILPQGRINLRNPVVLSGLAADRPTFGVAGRFWLSTDTAGGTLYYDTGSAWQQVGAGTTEVVDHAFDGADHTLAGSALGKIPVASSATAFTMEYPGVRLVMAGVAASLPASLFDGRLYYETDTGKWKRDNGATWVTVGVSRLGDTMTGALQIDAAAGTIEASALLELESTTKGFLLPRMSTTPSDTLEGIAVNGLMWYNTVLGAIKIFNGARAATLVKNLYNQRATKSISSSSAELTLTGGASVGSLTLPANWWLVSKSIRHKIYGTHNTNGTPTITLRFYMGATLLFDTGAITLGSGVTDKRFYAEFEIVCQSTGAAGVLETNGIFKLDSTWYDIVQTAGVAVDQTASCAMDLTAQFSAAHASNIFRIQQWSADAVP